MEENLKKLPYPRAVFFIIINEFCERFSFYGLRTILSLFLRDKLGYTDDGATIVYHVFTMFAYFFPVFGAVIADGYLGKYKTILSLSLVYAFGNILLSLTAIPVLNMPLVAFTMVALLLISFGTGGIKPCVSAFGGDQFKLPEQLAQLSTFFSIFYFSINSGSLISTFLTPILRQDVHCFNENSCYSLAFGVPGILMIISIVIFFAGRKIYVIKKPTENIIGKVTLCISHAIINKCKSKTKRDHWIEYADDKYDKGLIEDIKCFLRVAVMFIPLPVFWALFDQQGSRWTFQANRMDGKLGSYTIKADQMQFINPFLILVLIPLFEVAIYPCLTKLRIIRKPLDKMIIGGMLAATAFVISGIVELQLLPTYGVKLSSGYSQLRVYNGLPCTIDLTYINETIRIPELGYYEDLYLQTNSLQDIPYTMVFGQHSACNSLTEKEGVFRLYEKTANSFFVKSSGITDFIDNNEKVTNGCNVRLLANTMDLATFTLVNSKNVTALSYVSTDQNQRTISAGIYRMYLDNVMVLDNITLNFGGVYAIQAYSADGYSSAKYEVITPPNTVHILWLIPQYLIITLGEVMFSVTGLEFAYSQAPKTMKSVLQSCWLLTVAFGNVIVVLIVTGNFLDAQWKEFFLFAGLMVLVMLVFAIMACRYKYIDKEESLDDDHTDDIKMTKIQEASNEL